MRGSFVLFLSSAVGNFVTLFADTWVWKLHKIMCSAITFGFCCLTQLSVWSRQQNPLSFLRAFFIIT